jgi:hypothetical protein
VIIVVAVPSLEEHKQRGKHVTDIACALQIPEMTIHTILKSAQETETKALNLLMHLKVKTIYGRSDGMKAMERCLAMWIEDLLVSTTQPCKPSPHPREGCKFTSG